MNVVALQERLVDKFDDIEKILIKLGFDESKIKYNDRKHCITSTRPDADADNQNGFILYTDTLKWMYTTRSGNGNIFTLVMQLKHCSFPRALELIAKWIDCTEKDLQITYPFHGFYRSIEKARVYPEQTMKSYEEDALPDPDSLSQKFFLDGIDFKTQEYFGVRYDHDDDCVLIPIHDYNGSLVGCKARNNNPNCRMEERWWAKLPYAKSLVLYGWMENYKNIVDKQTVIIFEAEKSVMQCHSFGCNVALAIGGHSLSETQCRYLKTLYAKNVIVAFDEGVQEDEIRYEAKKLQSNKTNISYIYDRDHEILKKGSKDSPSDHGLHDFKKLLGKRIKLNG